MKYPDDFLNKVIQGDCLEIMKEMPDKCVDLLLTDPPYGMDYQSSRRIDKYKKIENDNDLKWLRPFLKESFRIQKDNSHIYLFCNDYAISEFRNELEKAGFTPKRTLVWVKNNHTSGDLEGDYANKTEFILFAQKGRRLLNGNRDTNVLNFNRTLNSFHPTEKPRGLFEHLISKSSEKEETIFDPFLGSGTTAIAAQSLGRNFIGIEISPEYCKIAEERLRQKPLIT